MGNAYITVVKEASVLVYIILIVLYVHLGVGCIYNNVY